MPKQWGGGGGGIYPEVMYRKGSLREVECVGVRPPTARIEHCFVYQADGRTLDANPAFTSHQEREEVVVVSF